MNITAILKTAYERIPKGIKYAFSPCFIRLMVNNPKFKKTWNELETFEKLTDIEKEKEQFKRLRETLKYAYEHVPYYKKLFQGVGFSPYDFSRVEELKKIPLLNKNIAVSVGEELYSLERIPYYESHTSGSTGKVFRVLLDRDSIYKERAFVTHYLSKFGYNPMKTRTLALWGHNRDKDYYFSPLKNEIVISPFRLFKENTFEDVWKDVAAFKPEVISGYPSAIYIFAQLVRKYKKKLSIKFVEFYAENFNQEIKDYIEKTFNCTAVARYGHTERAGFAELYQNAYKFNKLYGYTEFLPIGTDEQGNEIYRIVCTGFLSKKMPLIRYATDDTVRINEDGNIEIQGHTTSDLRVIGKNGVRIYKGTLSPHIEPFEKVRLYQYVQYQEGKAYLDLVLDEPLTKEDLNEMNSYFKRKCEGVLDIEIRVKDHLILNQRGKYNWVVNCIGKENEK